MERETWKRYMDSKYFVSSYGRVASLYKNSNSLEQITITESGIKLNAFLRQSGLNMKPTKSKTGYLALMMNLDGKSKHRYVHRLVAEMFIPNPNNLPTVNHKDGNHLNNNVNNLEWMSYADNNNHAIKNGLINVKNRNMAKGMPVSQYTLDGKLVATYYGVREASRNTGISSNSISVGVKNEWKSGGYFWSKDDSLLPEQVVYKIANKKTTREHVIPKKTKIDQYTADGEYIATYNSAAEAARETGCVTSSIGKILHGKMKTHHGFTFKVHE